MRLAIFTTALLVPSSLAFPWLRPEGMEALLNHPHARAVIEKRLKDRGLIGDTVGGVVGGVGTLVGGTVNSVLDSVVGLIPKNENVKGLKRFPEPEYPFKAPGQTDQRGPCPGLNTLANHGYLPRNGIATVGQVVKATQQVFNMGADLANLLAVGAAYDGGDILSQKMSIGGADDRVGLLEGALNSILGTPSGITGHGKFNEGDASATRYDFYQNNGDNFSFQPKLFQQMHQTALKVGNGTYNVATIKEHFKNRYEYSRSTNKQFYFNLPSAGVVMGAYYFIPGFFSNGTYIDGTGIPNEASITSFYGAKPNRKNAWNDPDLTYTHVPERIPEAGWYRRGVPMTVAEAVAGILDVYLYAKPPIGGNGADDSWVLGPVNIPDDPQAFSCFLYNALYANLPSEIFNSVRLTQVVVNSLSQLLAPGYKALGCDVNYPDQSAEAFKQYSERYVGKAKEQAVGSGWYQK